MAIILFFHRNLIMECCMELLRMISDEANMICTTEKKQTIGPDHIIKSLKSLGFEEWSHQMDNVLKEFKEAERRRTKRSNRNPMAASGLSHEELVRQQQALFAQARSASLAASRQPSALPVPRPGPPSTNSAQIESSAHCGSIQVATSW
mmetsp:Transcript_70400/g.187603  ORF Transcript_70400/g.187603 Transcript_70400/m.187603 type:complete len:149 (-) Transcript_70400:176-622(-)